MKYGDSKILMRKVWLGRIGEVKTRGWTDAACITWTHIKVISKRVELLCDTGEGDGDASISVW